MYKLPEQIRGFIGSRYRWYQQPKVIMMFKGIEKGKVNDNLEEVLNEFSTYLIFHKNEVNDTLTNYLSNLVNSLQKVGYNSDSYDRLRKLLDELTTDE